MSGEEIVSMKNIYKTFPGVKALTDVSIIVKKGEVHALVGENGAGKSTLIKILMGVYEKSKGEIYIEGVKKEIKNPIMARELGLSAVYQDITLAKHLSVGENFYLGHLPIKNKLFVDWKYINETTYSTLKKLDIDVDPTMQLSKLPVAKQEMVSIAKAVHYKAKLIVFDEPTALLTIDETHELFKLIEKLKASGIGIIYISHRLEEIFQICDTVTVLKDGYLSGTQKVSETNEDKLISLMVGRNIEDMYAINHKKTDEVVLELKNFSKDKVFTDINFKLYKGEILGMFGLIGSGRTDIVRCLFGAEKLNSGEVFINGNKVNIRKPSDSIKLGIGYVPEDRKTQGLALPLSVRENTNLVVYKKISRNGIINNKKEIGNAKKYCTELNTKTPSIEQKVKNLSGGNQQKVVISKWLAQNSEIFIFDEPTVGVDVGAKVEIYKVIAKLLEKGASVILISSYLPEILGLADRVVVISEGIQMSIIDIKDAREENIMKLASGIKG